MAFKRVSATVFIQNDQVVKSYAYSKFYPFGNLHTTLCILDRWLADEIVIIDISRQRSISRYVLDQISSTSISTPLIYGGGISSIDHVDQLISLGCDRIILEDALFSNHNLIHQAANKYGSQAIIGSLPFSYSPKSPTSLIFPDYLHNQYPNLSVQQLLDNCQSLPISELLISDFLHEGYSGNFDLKIAKFIFEKSNFLKGVLFFGGISAHIANTLLDYGNTAAILLGNPNYENELLIPTFKSLLLNNFLIRPSSSFPH